MKNAISELCDNFKSPNICAIRILTGMGDGRDRKKYLYKQ